MITIIANDSAPVNAVTPAADPIDADLRISVSLRSPPALAPAVPLHYLMIVKAKPPVSDHVQTTWVLRLH